MDKILEAIDGDTQTYLSLIKEQGLKVNDVLRHIHEQHLESEDPKKSEYKNMINKHVKHTIIGGKMLFQENKKDLEELQAQIEDMN